MVFKAHVEVRMLTYITRMPGLDDWRRIEVAQLTGATEHGMTTSMIIYNSHQPSSTVHRFHGSKRIAFCKNVLQHAIQQHTNNPDLVGFVFAGNANCDVAHWQSAMNQDQTYKMHFQEPMFVYANADPAAGADTAVVMGCFNGFTASQFNLNLQSLEAQHDALIVGWTWNCSHQSPP